VPSVSIVGDREVHVNEGSPVSLRCKISNVLDEPSFVFWYHGDRRILPSPAATSRQPPPVEITTKRILRDGSAVSSLTIASSAVSDAGVYSCRPAGLGPARVRLHVIRGEIRDLHYYSSVLSAILLLSLMIKVLFSRRFQVRGRH